MKIKHLIQGLEFRCVGGDASLEVLDLHDDSRKVTPQSLFVARQGTEASGESYIQDAIERGAIAVLCDAKPVKPDPQVTWIVGSTIDQALAGTLAERFYDHPSRQLRLVGITGTNGKTTVGFLIRHLLNASGYKCGLVGTIETDDGKSCQAAELTTPGAIELSRLLRKMVDHGCKAAVLEVSSHALDQGRTQALDFHVGVFTNLTGDHLDYHGHMEAYAQAKAKLFANLGPASWAILNAQDPHSNQMAARCEASVVWCQVTDGPIRLKDTQSSCAAEVLELSNTMSRAKFEGAWGCEELKIPMPGKYNLSNALLAIAAANAVTDISPFLHQATETMTGVPGRLEGVQIESGERLPCVMVDYAHTHDALENVLRTLKVSCSGRLLVVFGCGGDRDQTKRSKMAQVACEHADLIYVTTDNPRTEDPQLIMDQICTGVLPEAQSRVFCVVDRRDAIMAAVTEADADDTVLIAGKGHEDYQIIGRQRLHFDDREVATEALQMKVVNA